MSFTKHREKFNLNKSNADPNKPPGYDDCLSVIDMRPHKRKDKSRAPGMMFPKTPGLPMQPERGDVGHPNMTFQFPAGTAPQMNPAYVNSFTTPPVQFHPPMYQAPPRSPTARDLEVQRCAKILLEAVAAAWGSSSTDEDSSGEDEDEDSVPTSLTSGRILSSEQPPQPVYDHKIAQPSAEAQIGNLPSASEPSRRRSERKRSSAEGQHEQPEHVAKRPKSRNSIAGSPIDSPNGSDHNTPQQIPSSPHVPIYLPPPGKATTNPPRKGFIIKFDSKKGAVKPPTPPSDQSDMLTPSAPCPPPRHGTVIRLPNQPATRLNSNHALAEPVEGVPQYLPAPPSALPPHPSSSRPVNSPATKPPGFGPPVMGGFRPINGSGITYLPSNHNQQHYSFVPAAPDPRTQHLSQLPLQPPKNGTVVRLDEQALKFERPPPPVPPKNGTVLRLYGPAPVSEHPPRDKPPKNGTIIKFQRPYQGISRKKA